MLYFKQFPRTNYQIGSTLVSMVDITVRFKMLEYVKNNNEGLSILKYKIENDERPEEISFELYDSYDYTWTILLLNNVYSLHEDWLISEEILDSNVIREYGSLENAQNIFVEFYDEYGYEISSTDPNVKSRVSVYEKIFKENRKKEIIDVFDPRIIRKVQNDVENGIR